jgi:rhamnosyltransferase subunit A
MFVEKLVVPVINRLLVHVERHIFDADRDSVILVNGALATTASFGQTIKYMGERYNVICFDLPYAGQSRQHNDGSFLLTKEHEVDILAELIRHFSPKFLYSVSWGGLAALLALAREVSSIRCAVIGSFSPFLNQAMIDYVTTARRLLANGENLQAAQLLNDTVGQHLPGMVKLLNYRYLTRLPKDEQEQVAFHVDQILALKPETYLPMLSNIRCQVKFLNGELDQHTTVHDIRHISRYVEHARFATLPGTGHFLELEGRTQAATVRQEILGFFAGAGSVSLSSPRALSGSTLVGSAQEQTFAPPGLNAQFGG